MKLIHQTVRTLHDKFTDVPTTTFEIIERYLNCPKICRTCKESPIDSCKRFIYLKWLHRAEKFKDIIIA